METRPNKGAPGGSEGQPPPTDGAESAVPWEEAATFRETWLGFVSDPAEREAFRAVGRALYHMAAEATTGYGESGSATRGEVRAGLVDLRYLQGWFDAIRESAEASELTVQDTNLARFAGDLAAELANLASKIERELDAAAQAAAAAGDLQLG